MRDLNIAGNLINLERPAVMGILNVTPDSFYDGGRHNTPDWAIQKVEEMISQGADIIDVGAFSSSPRSKMISVEEELDRLEPVARVLFERFPGQAFSFDTYRAEVVRMLASYGSFLVNDISGFQFDDRLIPTVAELSLPYVLMHMKGTPETMTGEAHYDDVCLEVLGYMTEKLAQLKQAGIDQVVLDPGFGFAKTRRHNFEMLRKLDVFRIPGCPVLVGISRKSMIYKTLGIDVEEALTGTMALHMAALMRGADILRVHDVAETVQVIKMWEALQSDVNE